MLTPADVFAGQYPGLVHALRRRLSLSQEDAEDAATFAFEQYLRTEPPVGDNAGAWLYVVAKHQAFELARKTRRECELVGDAAGQSESADTAAERRLAAIAALEAVARLRPHQRTALSLRAGGHSYAEIAELTGHTYTWVNRHVTAGNAALRAKRGSRCTPT